MAGADPATFEREYAQLRSLAHAYVRRFSGSETLQATALVHEAYLRLAKDTAKYADRAHFLCTAALAMRQILVDHARGRQRIKRGGEFSRVTLDAAEIAAGGHVDVLDLDEALRRLQEWDARQSQVVTLRFFIGLSVAEVADVLGISEKTVKRDWAMARAWLQRELARADR